MTDPLTPPTIDYENLFDRRVAASFYGTEPEPHGRLYDDDRGLYVRSDVDGSPYVHDLVQFSPDVLAFTSSGTPLPIPSAAHHRQIVGDGDWIHFCVRIGGGDSESISGHDKIAIPGRSCMISRYPARSSIERLADQGETWRVACLWVRPAALPNLLEMTRSGIPAQLRWLADGGSYDLRYREVPLSPRVSLAVNDILTCKFTGGVRRAFIFSKYLEMLTTIYQKMVDQLESPEAPAIRLSSRDIDRIAKVERILSSETEALESLETLARRVGINRTKLVLGFRSLYGTSVQAYRRDCRLQRASELLRNEGLPVNEVALRVGYSEISSFTRAFTRKFGVLPSDCKSSESVGGRSARSRPV